MNEAPPAFLAAAIEARPETENEDKLERLRRLVAQCRDLEADKADLEERLKQTNIKLEEMKRKTLPDLFAEVKTTTIGLEPEGNLPGYNATVKDYYYANIPASWPEDQRRAAFAYLGEIGAGDLIKTEVVTAFPREQREEAVEFAEHNASEGYTVALKESVAFQTLTAWLKEQITKHGVMPDLDKINGQVGRIVEIKPAKDKK